MRKAMLKYKRLREKTEIKQKSNKGFTLVELLVAIAILSLVVVPTLSVFVSATKANSRARNTLQATVTANSVLESAKSFSIYVYSTQCNKAYSSSNANQFSLIAGSTTKSLIELGGSCGEVPIDDTSEPGRVLIGTPTKNNVFKPEQDRYAFCINGIKQSQGTYDALIVFEKGDYQSISIGGTTFDEDDVSDTYKNYNKEYSITVYVYKHDSTPGYLGKDLNGDMGALEVITGSKMDSAKEPEN